GEGFLEDYAHLAAGYLALGAATDAPIWERRARSLADAIRDRFVRPDGLLLTTTHRDALGLQALDVRDQYAPSGTAAASALFARLGLSDSSYAALARKILERMAPTIAAAPERWAAFTASAAALAERAPPAAATVALDSAAHVKAEVLGVQGGDRRAMRITLAIDAGYHLNANPASRDYLIPTSVRIAGRPDAKIAYPPGQTFRPKFLAEDIAVYEGSVAIAVELPGG